MKIIVPTMLFLAAALVAVSLQTVHSAVESAHKIPTPDLTDRSAELAWSWDDELRQDQAQLQSTSLTGSEREAG